MQDDIRTMDRKPSVAACCYGKQVFAQRSTASQVASRMKRKGRAGVQVYKCPHCSNYHIGTRQR